MSFTVLRVVCAVAVIAAHEHWGWVLALALTGFYSDYLDGLFARKWHVVSAEGAFLDPLTDKILCQVLLWRLAIHYDSVWYVVVALLVLAYDVTTTTMRLAGTRVRLTTSHLAKLKTAALMLGLAIGLVGILWPPIHSIGLTLLLLASALAAFSLAQYTAHILGRRPTLIEHADSVAGIDFRAWQREGIQHVLFDIEGTLTPWGGEKISPETLATLQDARRAGMQTFSLITNLSSKRRQRVAAISRQVDAKTYRVAVRRRDRKPSPRMVRSILREIEATASHTGLVGDKAVDVLAARRAGLARAVWVKRLGTTDHPLDKYLYRPVEPLLKWLFE